MHVIVQTTTVFFYKAKMLYRPVVLHLGEGSKPVLDGKSVRRVSRISPKIGNFYEKIAIPWVSYFHTP